MTKVKSICFVLGLRHLMYLFGILISVIFAVKTEKNSLSAKVFVVIVVTSSICVYLHDDHIIKFTQFKLWRGGGRGRTDSFQLGKDAKDCPRKISLAGCVIFNYEI